MKSSWLENQKQQTTKAMNKYELNKAVLDLLDTLAKEELVISPTPASAVMVEEAEPETVEMVEEQITPMVSEVEVATPQPEKPMSNFKRNKIRLMEALDVSLALAEQVDFAQGEAIRARLTKGAYPNAFIKDVFSMNRLKQLFNFIQWSEVVTRVTSDSITVLQASLPKQVVAYAPWCELEELKTVPGGLQSVKVHADQKGELYLATPFRPQTKYVTAHLVKDESGVERLLAWFPGKEISGTLKDGLSTQVVRTGWK